MPGEAADMHLVDDRLRKWPGGRNVPLPIVGGWIGDDAPEGGCRIGPRSARMIAAAVRWPSNAFPIRIKEYLLRIESQALCRVERTRDPISIDLSRHNPGQERMPVVICAIPISIEFDHLGWFGIVYMVKQQNFDGCAILL